MAVGTSVTGSASTCLPLSALDHIGTSNTATIGGGKITSTHVVQTNTPLSLCGYDFTVTAFENHALLQGGYIHSAGDKWEKSVSHFVLQQGAYFKTTANGTLDLDNVTVNLSTGYTRADVRF